MGRWGADARAHFFRFDFLHKTGDRCNVDGD